jgi:NAD+ synthetase
VRIALAQIDTTVGKVAANEARILAAIDEARAQGASLVVFPELAVTGYPPRDLLYQESLVREAARATARIALAARDLTVILGTVEPDSRGPGGRPLRRNVASVLSQGSVHASRAKTLLPAYDVFMEPRWFSPATSNEPLAIEGRSCGLLVCEDLWDEEYARHPGPELRAQGAEILFCLSASPYRQGIQEERLRRARRLGGPLVYVNAVGAEDELVFDGGSFVLDVQGAVVCALPRFLEKVAVFDLEAPPPQPSPASGGESSEAEEIFQALVLGVRDFARKNGLARATLGLSGGVDSALVACIAKEALGPERVHALAIPSRFTDRRSTEDARALARALGITFDVVPLEPLHEAALGALEPLLAGSATGKENLQARLRMLVLMADVNQKGGLLLNTSNKTELALGYGTLQGDLAGSLGVIADLTKPQVYALAQLYQRKTGAIPPYVLARAPSAELAKDQVDPWDYERISPLVEALVSGEEPRDLVARGASPEEVASLARLVQRAEHKRRQAPIGLKVARTSFGAGRLVPVTQGV